MPTDFPLVDVVSVRPVAAWRLGLRFSDGSTGEYDLGPLLERGGPMVEPLRSPQYFPRVFVEDGVPTWPNGFDLDPIALYLEMRAAGTLRQPAA
jgi:hypothetical protein